MSNLVSSEAGHSESSRHTLSDKPTASPGGTVNRRSRTVTQDRHRDESKRSRSGCLVCRARKVKCDEKHPSCAQCEKRNVTCKWHHDNTALEPIVRGRGVLACAGCRSKKAKCGGPNPRGVCDRCERLSQMCEWPESAKSQHETLSPPVQRITASPQFEQHPPREPSPIHSQPSPRPPNIDRGELHRLSKIYFQTVHYYGFYSFVHQPHYFGLLETGREPRELSLLMAASALRFGNNEPSVDMLRKADAWVDDVLPCLLSRLRRGFGAVHLMCILLAQLHESARGNHTSAWILVGDAVRMMQLMRLHTFDITYQALPNNRLGALCQPESLRRLAWSVFILDTIADGGQYGFHNLTDNAFQIQLPCTEESFFRDQPKTTAPLLNAAGVSFEGDGHQLGLSAHLIRTYNIRRQILHFASQIKNRNGQPDISWTQLQHLEGDLDRLVASLPASLAYSESQYYILADGLTAFVNLHALRHNCYIILNRAKLLIAELDEQAAPAIPLYRRERIARAIPVSRIIADGLKHSVNFEPTMGVQAYVALEILLFEPMRLAAIDASPNIKTPMIVSAITTLLTLLRRLSRVTATIAALHVEACFRLCKCDHIDLLIDVDWQALRSEYPLMGQDPAEFDFRDMRLERGERYRRTGKVEDTLDMGLGSITAFPSRDASPGSMTASQGPIDAGDFVRPVASGYNDHNPRINASINEATGSVFSSITNESLNPLDRLGYPSSMAPGIQAQSTSNFDQTIPQTQTDTNETIFQSFTDGQNDLHRGLAGWDTTGVYDRELDMNQTDMGDLWNLFEPSAFGGPLEDPPWDWRG